MTHDPFMRGVFEAFAFALGACIASFLNVVIWRVPRGESVCAPPSHCPKCGSPIPWWCNLPIVSWIVLRGRCRSCREGISFRYPLVEFIGGVLFLAAFWRYGYFAPLAWVWIALMIVGSFIDFDHMLLPDFVTVGGMIYGAIVSVAFWAVKAFTPYHFHNFAAQNFEIPVLHSILGLLLGFGLLWLVMFFGTIAFKREAMGLGDVFLMGAVGAIFGPVAGVATLILSALYGSVIGTVMIALNKTRLGKYTSIPFGPYICLGCLTWMFYGPEMVDLYIGILTGK
ncbi:MAG: prepilin peptidase [Kiritimatiellae bacterium]|nr:prepilin peptidase [Kiritimatiellia bacterium]